MSRTTANAVGELVKVKSGVSLTPFIEAANAIVTKNCTHEDFTETELELIERWLSAHCYRQRELQVASEKAGPAARSFESKVELGFDNTTYGQIAIRLDWSGALAKLNDKMKKTGGQVTVGVTWLGESTDDETS